MCFLKYFCQIVLSYRKLSLYLRCPSGEIGGWRRICFILKIESGKFNLKKDIVKDAYVVVFVRYAHAANVYKQRGCINCSFLQGFPEPDFR